MLDTNFVFNEIFAALRDLRGFHNRDSGIYALFERLNAYCVDDLFSLRGPQQVAVAPFGIVKMPYFSMGAINSTHLFGLDELIIFAFYAANVKRYARVADIGANIGLHSIMLAKLGVQVQSYEPDPITFARLKENLVLNEVSEAVDTNLKAVSTDNGVLEFTRVLGNITGSHLTGAKPSPYGKLEQFYVETVRLVDVMRSVDLMKIDVEGHEAEILRRTSRADWEAVDAIVEIGTEVNAQSVYNHLSHIGVRMFSQKNSWKQVSTLEQMPTTYKEGSLFISTKDEMPWG